MKKRNAFLAAALSAAMAFSVAPAADAEPTNGETASISGDDTTNKATGTDEDGTDTPDSKDDKEEKSEGLDPNKGTWDKGGASSDPAPEGSFSSSGLNRVEAYVNSNHFKMLTAIVSLIAGVITVGSQLAAIVISVSPTAKAQFEAFMKQFS